MMATWHPLVLRCGPYRVAAALPTHPGFDPERSAIRPGGTFVLLGQAAVSSVASGTQDDVEHALVWVNRYVVETYEAEFDLEAFFPGARGSRPAASSRRPQ
jgi:hypothetical protein